MLTFSELLYERCKEIKPQYGGITKDSLIKAYDTLIKDHDLITEKIFGSLEPGTGFNYHFDIANPDAEDIPEVTRNNPDIGSHCQELNSAHYEVAYTAMITHVRELLVQTLQVRKVLKDKFDYPEDIDEFIEFLFAPLEHIDSEEWEEV